jgi:hypothetical protein
MGFDYLVVLWQGRKSIAHPYSLSGALVSISSLEFGARKGWEEMGKRTIVSHRVEIQAHQIWQQEVIATRIPCAIANIHGIRAVCAAPRRGEVVLWCHCVSSVSKELLSATARRQRQSLLSFAQCQWDP